MKDFRYHLSVHDCRAIKSAEIDLSEITVLTGINASGKSTIARMFRDLIELSAEYERLLAVRMWNNRMDMWRYAIGGMRTQIESVKLLQKKNVPRCLAKGTLLLPDAIEMLDIALQDVLLQVDGENSFVIQRIQRILGLNEDEKDVLSVFRNEATRVLERFKQRQSRRSYVAYQDLMQGNALKEGHVELAEAGRTVFSNDTRRDTLDGILFVKRAIYIESPLKSIPLFVTPTELNMGDAFTRIKEDVASASVDGLSELNDILSGDVDFVRDLEGDYPKELRSLLGRDGHWMYRRRDGRNFDLDECATGIKALAILNILHSHGWLDAETLLVIDEPEAHLHPQWIVEYARILLLLAKRLRVRIVMTSHSPDMVNAIHTIGMALGMGADISFYLAEEDEKERFRFNYRSLGNEVGDIFKAYNVSFDRIDVYARNGLSK